MSLRSGLRAVDELDESEVSVVTLERLERRLNEECGELRWILRACARRLLIASASC